MEPWLICGHTALSIRTPPPTPWRVFSIWSLMMASQNVGMDAALLRELIDAAA